MVFGTYGMVIKSKLCVCLPTVIRKNVILHGFQHILQAEASILR